MPSAEVYEITGAANTAIDTGALNFPMAGPIDAIIIQVSPSAAMTSANVQLFDPDLGTGQLVAFASGTSSTPIVIGWGVGVGGAALAQTGATTYLGGLPAPIPPRIRIVVPAFGAGVIATLRIVGHWSGR
jgi:hypothetical protein